MVKWIGFSLDEAARVLRMQAGEEFQKGLIRFPLVDDVPMRRQGAIDLVVDVMGWPKPPRSRCWLCPNQADEEWMELPAEEFAKAVTVDRQLRERDPHLFLHESLKPLDEVVFGEQRDFSRACDSGVCFL